jgi:hypothetical protein
VKPPLAVVPLRLVVHATVVVCQVHLDPPERPENQDDPENRVPPVYPETPANLQFNHVNPSHHHHASHAHKDPLAHPDLLDLPAMLVLLVSPDTPERMPHLENPDNLELPENQVLQLNPNLWCPENLDPLVKPAHPVLPDLLVNLALMELLDPLDPRDHPDPMDPLVKTVNPEHPVNLDQPDRPARRVSARNTAPSMVVCSSKMVPDDRRPSPWAILSSFSCLQHFIQVSSTTAFAGVVVFSSSSYFSLLLVFPTLFVP